MPNVRGTEPRSARRTTPTRRISAPPKRRPRRRTTRRRTTLRAERPFAQGVSVERMARTLRVPPLGAPQIVSLAVLVLVVAGLLFTAVREEFYVYRENVTIEEARYTPASTIYEQAGIDSYHVFFVNPRHVAQRLEMLPYVRRAQVRVGFPSSVHIRVEERKPILVWERGDGQFWVDEEGVAVPVLEEMPALVRLVDPESLGTFRRKDTFSQDVEEQLAPSLLAAIMTTRTHLPDVRVVYYDSTYGLRIIVPTRAGNVEVILGPLTGLEERVARLPDILTQVEAREGRVTRIDLTRPEAVFWEQ